MLVGWESRGTSAMGLLPFLSWPHWHWLHARLVYFNVLLGRETSVASWRKTIILSVHFYLLSKQRCHREMIAPALWRETDEGQDRKTKQYYKYWCNISTRQLWYCRWNHDVTDQSYNDESWYHYLTSSMLLSISMANVGQKATECRVLTHGFLPLEGLRGIAWGPRGQCLQRTGASLSSQ